MAIEAVNKTLGEHGAPVYVRHEIVHNDYVVKDFIDRGVVFVDDLEEIPQNHRTTRPVIFSAHGVSKAVEAQAKDLGMTVLDATCPLVKIVHKRLQKGERDDVQTILIGKKNHVEVQGSMGQVTQDYSVLLVTSPDDIDTLRPLIRNTAKLRWATQTTLSVDDTRDIIKALEDAFPDIQAPGKETICYATTNRQEAVKELVKFGAEIVAIVGHHTSSNSKNLVKTALAAGASQAFLLEDPSKAFEKLQNYWATADNITLGISSGASVPEHLVEATLDTLRQYFDLTIKPVQLQDPKMMQDEQVVFPVPKTKLA